MFCCSKKNNKVRDFHTIQKETESKEITPILKSKRQRLKRRSIYPISNPEDKKAVIDTYTYTDTNKEVKSNKAVIEERHQKREAFTKKFLAEIIHCGGCKEKFCLGDHALKINCGSCNQFFHCSIAGSCVGPNCSVILDGKKECMKYCRRCVNPKLRINNLEDGECLCRVCEKDPLIDNTFLKI